MTKSPRRGARWLHERRQRNASRAIALGGIELGSSNAQKFADKMCSGARRLTSVRCGRHVDDIAMAGEIVSGGHLYYVVMMSSFN